MRIDQNHWLLSRPIAHRGLWGGDIIENSITAYKKAAELGYPIEIDLFLTTDKKLVCFHDDNLKRMTGVDKLIYNCSLEELQSLSLSNTNEKIPTFEQVKEIACGKVPLLIELKSHPQKDFVDIVVNSLKDYKGEFAVQSFNPTYIKKIKNLAPEFIRGVLGTECCSKEQNFFIRYVLKHMPLNRKIEPDFISYSHTGLPLKTKVPVIAWTLTDKTALEKVKPHCKNFIFENFIPD